MKKIISLFQRNYETDYLVRDEIVTGAEWVLNGEGVATRKLDGTCCLIKEGKLYKRYTVKKNKIPPDDFIPATKRDPKTGKMEGWRPVTNSPEDKYHREAFEHNKQINQIEDGTYELIGEKINGNPEYRFCRKGHILVKHGSTVYKDVPTDYKLLKEWFMHRDIEGIVWHHPDGRMVKIKKKDFGLKRN